MTYSGIQLRQLSYHGPNRPPAVIDFGPGLNVVYGASNTGKSFIVETIDFMLGGKGPLTDIPESNGYDRILLAFTVGGSGYTIQRSMAGGAFLLFSGLSDGDLPSGDGIELAETHSDRNDANLSTFFLEKLGLSHRRIRKNAKNETVSLSFRNLARLAIVNEEEIIQKRSPLSDGNYTADTANTSVFKLLITGVDDSSLVAKTDRSPEELKREAQIELLDQLIADQAKRIERVSGSKDELSTQEQRIARAIEVRSDQLAVTENLYKGLAATRRSILKRLEEGQNRHTEVTTLLGRFSLLRSHYSSDLERLNGIKEAGNIFSALGHAQCPVCGSLPENHRPEDTCQGDVELTVLAAEKEIEKIESRELELNDTIKVLNTESKSLEQRIPDLERSLRDASVQMDTIVAPDLRKMRASYRELADKGASVRESLSLFDTKSELEARRVQLDRSNEAAATVSEQYFRLTNSMVEPFSKLVQSILTRWQFPDSERVHFDLEAKDIVISGKPRTSFGKGLRAITQAAFSIALRELCIRSNSPHPGFVILDSPLLSYREPDGPEDDLSGTALNQNFYDYLLDSGVTGQTIIVENTDPPAKIETRSQTVEFTGTPGRGRFGLFPVPSLNENSSS